MNDKKTKKYDNPKKKDSFFFGNPEKKGFSGIA
jgi:hypothetical protein